MKDIVIQTNHPETFRFQTRPSGDIEVVKSKSVQSHEGSIGRAATAGGIYDKVLGVIPKDKRFEVAQFLVTAGI